jgi:hypothetical protein
MRTPTQAKPVARDSRTRLGSSPCGRIIRNPSLLREAFALAMSRQSKRSEGDGADC